MSLSFHALSQHDAESIVHWHYDGPYSVYGKKVEIGIARWSAAKVMRYLGRVDEALKTQMELLQLPELKGSDNEGYTQEEIGECLLLLGRSAEAAPHFAEAWKILHDDPWLKRDEPKRLERMKRLSAVK